MFKFPNYNKNIINISATFSKMLGKSTEVKTLKILEKELKKDYKNVVFIIFDGLGINPIKINLKPDSFLRKNIRQVLTSVFPSTTTNATTTLMSAQYPIQHGWLGWSMYFKELNRAVDIYRLRDSYTNEEIDPDFMNKRLPFDPYYKDAKKYEINKVFPVYVKDGIEKNNYVFSNNEEMFEHIKMCCNQKGKQFVYVYNGEPDATMHSFGVSSPEANKMINKLSDLVQKLHNETSDTLIVISADHGQVDIDDYLYIYQNQQLLDMLECAPYLEPRATAFNVKKGMEKEFVKIFNKHYKKDYKLYPSKKLIDRGVFGKSDGSKDKLLGDFIAICKSNKQFVFSINHTKFKGHHTSLTKEMQVPLIIISKR